MTSVLPPLRNDASVPTMPTYEQKKKTFPLCTWGGTQTMVSSYSIDYGKKDGNPSEKRPCSAARRNRPHPSKFFLNWRVPSKPTLNNKRSFEPYEAEYSNILQNFKEEYKGNIDSKSIPKTTPSNENTQLIENETLKLFERLKQSEKQDATLQPPVQTINVEAISVVADLLQRANPQEKEELERVLGISGRDNRQCGTCNVITPEAIIVLEQVLQKAGITDNDSAIRFLLSIGHIIMSITNPRACSPRPRPTEEKERKHMLRSAPINSPNFLIPNSRDCSASNKASLNSELKEIAEKKYHTIKLNNSPLENVPRLPKIRAPKRQSLYRQRRMTNPQVENKLATFVLPHRVVHRTFTIHPEWD
ncbi:uncharacterized protein LOC124438110 [Xenia sp. Carnegie-2017]|uniref:uncharacterized protein LOC124438110 n=1 Tax=Xenia sp. Carnegie-2017 TaxID=2897299 RepID=UPI001F04A0CB|nr:uncharacterized protein LOC124438110 [Xenia sp. Carnegie-2017]